MLRYSASGNLGGDDLVTINTTDTFAVVNGLEPGTVYYAWVAAQCGDELSLYAVFPTFSTDTACYTLASAEVGDVAATSAVINWSYTENGEAHTGVSITVIDQDDSTSAPYNFEADGITTFLTNLTEGHHYRIELRTLCVTFSAQPVVLTIFPYRAPCAQSGTGTTPLYSLGNPFRTDFEHAVGLTLYKAEELGTSKKTALLMSISHSC